MRDRHSSPNSIYCIRCGYCLNGVCDACPECGNTFSLEDSSSFRAERQISNSARRFHAFVFGFALGNFMLLVGACFALGIPGNAEAPLWLKIPIHVFAFGIMLGPAGVFVQYIVCGMASVILIEIVFMRSPQTADRITRAIALFGRKKLRVGK